MAKEHGSDPYDYDYDDVRCVEIPVGREDEVSIFRRRRSKSRPLRSLIAAMCSLYFIRSTSLFDVRSLNTLAPLHSAPYRIASHVNRRTHFCPDNRTKKWRMLPKMHHAHENGILVHTLVMKFYDNPTPLVWQPPSSPPRLCPQAAGLRRV